MFTASRISPKTFFAAAALSIVAVVPALAATNVNPTVNATGRVVFDFKGSGENKSTFASNGSLSADGALDFVKQGSGDLIANIGATGYSLYNLHYQWYDLYNENIGVPYYLVRRVTATGTIVEDVGDNVSFTSGSNSASLLAWKSGEVRVEEGILELVGYVNAWFSFGSVFNNYYDADYGTANGKMTGASRITINNGAVIDLSGNNNLLSRGNKIGMVATNAGTIYQFLKNVQAGDLGTASTATVRTGDSSMLHLGVHIDAWSENTRTERSDETYLDNSLAFGGSIGVLAGKAAVYKTGAGNLTLLNTSAAYYGDLYAAGGELTLQGDNSAASGVVYSFTDVVGDTVWKAKISTAFSHANSVNIAGTYNEAGVNGESRLGAAARGKEIVGYVTQAIADTNPAEHYEYTSPKEEYFERSSAATLVIAENQQIRNFQSYFNGGFAVSSGTTAEDAVTSASYASLSPTRTEGATIDNIVYASPIIVGTGTGSSLVIPGGNYTETDGTYTLNTDSATGEMIGGVLLINQESGMGGIYSGSIVGCRVSIYDKTAFNENTEADEDKDDDEADDPADRLAAVLQGTTAIETALQTIYGKEDVSSELETLDIQTDGSFALDNTVAWDVVNYYKKTQGGHEFYIDYQADSTVTGGIVALDGAGDLAFLLEQSKFSGIQIAATRTGKTVLNIAALNTLEGSVVVKGGNVSVISSQDDTLKTKLSFAKNTKLIFSSGETISTVVRTGTTVNSTNGRITGYTDTPGGNTILVGTLRKAVVGFELVQDLVYGDVYVERGINLDFAGTDSIFPNANSLTLWSGSSLTSNDSDIAASSISLKDDYVQEIKNLTGDSNSRIDMSGYGALVVKSTSNEADSYSGLTLGNFAGTIRGNGSLVKSGSETFTLSGGNKVIYTGTTEVTAGTLKVSAESGLTQSSALILGAGTSASMTGAQSLRNLFGAASSSLTVSGALTVGSDAAAANGDNRSYLANNLGTSSSGTYSNDVSFSRFSGTYDLEGTLIADASFTNASQADATKTYLTTAVRSAYSGFDAGTLEAFVGKTNYDGSTLLSQADYDAIIAFAKKPDSSGVSISWADAEAAGTTTVAISASDVLEKLAEAYAGLAQEKFFLDNIGKTSSGYYSPAILRGFFGSSAEYIKYLRNPENEAEELLTTPTGETDAQKAVTNKARFEKIVECYNELSADKAETTLKTACATEASARAKFTMDFGSVKNLGGTSMLTDDDNEEIDTVLGEYGIALESGDESEIATKLAAVVALYNELAARKTTISNKALFAGISVPGAFANSVTTDGALVNASWVDDLAFAGTLTATSLTKVGDNTLTLTGTLNVSGISVQAGTLSVLAAKLPSSLSGGISVDRNATLAVETSGTGTTTFGYTVSGLGNFVKRGSGKLILSENVRYSGTTTVEAGTLQMTLRNPETDSDGTHVPAQGNIYVTGDGAGLIFAQDADEDVEWTSALSVSGANASIEKTGADTLKISGASTFSAQADLIVSAGTLAFTGSLETSDKLSATIATGATLSLAKFTLTENGSVYFSGNGALEIAADGTTPVALNGDGQSVVGTVSANGNGIALDTAFTGTVLVSSGELALSGDSLFDYARGITIASGATLSVAAGSEQSVKQISGAGRISLAGTLSVANDDSGERIAWDYTSTGSYIYDEGKLFSASPFTGTVDGDGTLQIAGQGFTQLQGTVKSAVEISGGGQLVIAAEAAKTLYDESKTISVDGVSAYYTDAQGRRVCGAASEPSSLDPSANDAENFATEISAERTGTFYEDSQYVPRNLTAYYTDDSGNKVSVSAANVIVDDDSGKLIDKTSRREVTVSATEWDYVPDDASGDEISANWTVLDADGNVVEDPATTIIWSATDKKFVLSSDYTAGYRWLVEVTADDGSVSYVPADLSEVTAHVNASEVILSADDSTTTVSLDSGTLEFSNGGMLGKVGDGTLSIAASDIADCGGVNVYEGTLALTTGTSGDWVFSEDNIARVALGAVLSYEVATGITPDFTTVYGSGTLEFTGYGEFNISGDDDDLNVLPTTNPGGDDDGKFFNGDIRFNGSFDVNVSDVTIPSVSTGTDATLTMSDVTVQQLRNSEILGKFYVNGDVNVVGEKSASGLATGSASRRIAVNTVDIGGNGSLTLKNIGFGANVDGDFTVLVDKTSVSNAFYYGLTEDISDSLASDESRIDFEAGIAPNDPAGTTALKNLSLIQSSKVGTSTGYTWTIDAANLSSAGSTDRDSVFGVSKTVYSQLKKNNGKIYIGVEAGTMALTNLADFTGTTANGVSIDLLTLRSTVRDTAGTLEIVGDSAATLSKTISGTGSVEFSGDAVTTVTAKQTYLGKTTISGTANFSGAGKENHSSEFTVASTGTLIGGVTLVGREVACTGSIVRNMNDSGAAGTATLKLSLTDPRLPDSVVLQMEVSSSGEVKKSSVYSAATLEKLGVTVDSVASAVSDGTVEVKITDSALGETYSVFVPVDTSAFPKKVGETATYASSALGVKTTFVLESGATWQANIASGDGVVADLAVIESGAKIVLDGLDSASALGKKLTLITASEISDGTSSSSTSGTGAGTASVFDTTAGTSSYEISEIVADAIRAGGVADGQEVMVFTDTDGNVSVRRIISDFSALNVDYSRGISKSFLTALSAISSYEGQAEEGVLNADGIVAGKGKDLFFALNSLTAGALASEADRLSPNAFASMLAMPAAAFHSDVARIHERLDQRRYDGANPLRETGEYEFFVFAQSDLAENGNAKDAPIFDYNLYGAVAGFDWKPDFETTLGLALGYSYGKAKIHGGGKINMDDMRITAFAGRLLGNFYLDGGVQAGMGTFDSRRSSVAGTTSGDTNSLFAGAFVTFGSVYSVWQDKRSGEGLYFTPSVGLSYFHTSIDGFRESGTAGLDTDDMDGDSLRARLALGLQWVIPGDEWTWRLGLEAAYAHDFLGKEMDADSRFVAGGSKFSTTARALPTDIFSLTPTLNVQVSERDSIWLGYDLEIDTDSGVSHGLNAGYRHRF